ncbi:MAG: DUF4127 family protein [Clostridia bacterium]|nr:DUF4127 family protein [Clostridia bacterium]
MKRLTALLLTAIMVFTIIPASFLSASAHGTGVGKDGYENLSIDNAPGQIIPSTVDVDGSEDDTGWDHDDWQTVNAGTGIWDAVYYRSSDFSYKYQLHSDYQYLYGIVKLDINDIYNGTLGDITIWLNSDSTAKHYTAKLVFSTSNVTKNAGTFTPSIHFYDGTTKAFDTLPAGTNTIEKSLYAVSNVDGVITVEFRCLTEVLCGEAQKAMTAYVSVATAYEGGAVVQNLYHPRFDAEIDASGINPATAWPANASEITQREIYALPNADYSKVLPNEMVIDGKLEEGVWASFTTMYTEDKDRFEYRDEGKFTPVDFGTVKYHHNLVGLFSNTITGETTKANALNGHTDNDNYTDVPFKYKYDIRYDSKYLYGAVVAYADVNTLKRAQPDLGNVNLVLTVRTGKMNSDGSQAISSTVKNLYIANTTSVGITGKGTKYTMGTSWTTTFEFQGQDAKNAGIKGGSNRRSDFLVEYEFSIPLTALTDDGKAPDEGDLYGYIISVNTDKWTVGGNHQNNGYLTAEQKQGHSEMPTNSSGWSGCTSFGNVFTKTSAVNTENWEADGKLEGGRWTAILAADNKIDYGARNAADASHLIGPSGDPSVYDNYENRSNTKFSTEHLAYNLITDGDYLYGVALIEDTNWSPITVDPTTGNYKDGRCINIWINNGVARWHDWYDNRLAFGIDANGNTIVHLRNHYANSGEFYGGTENILTGVYNAYANADDGLAALRNRGFIIANDVIGLSDSNNTASESKKVKFADKWLMHPTEAVTTQGVEAVLKDVEGRANTKVLEFKVPLEMLCVTENNESLTGVNDYAFSYAVSVGGNGANAGGNNSEFCHPMMSNRKMTESGAGQDEGVLYIGWGSNGHWSSQESIIVGTNKRLTNNVPDGKLQEAYWDTVDELIKVDGATGEWQSPPTGDDHVDYSYRVYTGREWLYGAAVINSTATANNTKFTIYFNNKVTGSNVSNKATGSMEIKLDEDMEPYITIKAADGKTYTYSGFVSDGSALHGDVEKAIVPFNETLYRYGLSAGNYLTGTKNYGYASMKTINGVTYVEFKINLDKYVVDNSGKILFQYQQSDNGGSNQWTQDKNIDEFYIEPREKIEYVVSVEQDTNVLFHCGGDDYQLWVTDVNPGNSNIGNWGGYIINQDIASYVKQDGWSYILMCPTEIENVYKVEAINWLGVYDASTEAAWNKWQNTYIPNLHDGAILYKLIDVSGATYPEHLQWSYNAGHELTGMLDKILDAGKYVRFANFNPDGTTLEEVVTQMGNTDVPYDMRGYATFATFEPFEFPGANLNDKQNHTTAYPDNNWTFTTDYVVEPLKNFAPENITVDGYLNDTGWDNNKWIHVSNNVNGNLQNPGDNVNTTTEFEYDYQIRTDGEYVYIAALMDREADFDIASNGWKSSPHFRIWIQSQGEGYDFDGNGTITDNEKFYDAVSFTHFFDIRLGAVVDPNNGSGNIQSSIVVDKYSYTKETLSFNPLNPGCDVHESAQDSVAVKDNGNGTLTLTYQGATLRFGTHTNGRNSWWHAPNGGNPQTTGETTTMDINQKFGQNSVFYGENKTVFENTSEGKGNSYTSDSWYAQPKITKYTYGEEHAAYNTTQDGKKTVVEFKFALADIGTDKEHGFKYYVECSSVGSTTSNAFVLFHPHYTVEADNGDSAYGGYHLPFWVWGESAFYCDEQWFYDNDLLNPRTPVVSLGGQVVNGYKSGTTNWSSAVRFGVLYNAEYIDDVYGKTDWTGAEDIYKDATYWDVKEIGMLVGVSQRLQLKGTDVELYTDTKYANYADSDSIIHRVNDTNMADYSSYIYYAVVNTSAHEDDELTFRGVVEYYPYDDIYYDHDIPTKLPNDQPGHSFRPTYYSHALTRSFNMIAKGYQTYGNSANMPGLEKPIVQIDKVENANGIKVAYIPLDNRPVNYQRVQYLAQSVGIDLLMPPEELFKNTSDNDGNGTANGIDSDSGNPLQLLNWLKNEASAASYYVLSLDMLFSGGLVGSRAAEVDPDYDDGMATYLEGIDSYEIGTIDANTGMYTLSAGEQAIVDYLVELAAREDKYVVYFDTVMRLASTTYYGDYTLTDYNALRSGYAMADRQQLFGANLTLENIFAGYNKDVNGNNVSANGNSYTCTVEGNTYSTNKIDQYLKNRKRKLTIIDTLLQAEGKNGKRTADNIDKLILGADDSSPTTTIQTNELRYLEEKLLGDNTNVVVMAAADELGQLGISDVTTAIYGKVNVNVHFYGAGKDEAADEYDRGTLSTTVKAHVKAAGGYYDYNKEGGLDVLILTRTDMSDGVKGYNTTEYATLVANVKTLLAKAQANINANIPTCIVDASGDKGEGTLSAYMFGTNFKNYSHVGSDVAKYALTDVGLLLGYSEWNTVANALGISLGNAIARYTYLQNSAKITTESNYGFMKNITHAFVKDIAYREFGANAGEKFYQYAPVITDKINASDIYVGEIDALGTNRSEAFTKVKASDLYWPWNRHFEADFNISFQNPKTGNVAMTGNDPDAPFEAVVITPIDQFGNGQTASLNDGVATPVREGMSVSGYINDLTTPEWAQPPRNNAIQEIVFDLGQYSELATVKLHLFALNGSHYNDWGIGSPYKITVYGSNHRDRDWEEIGAIYPYETGTGDYNMPDGNTSPGDYYSFLPELTGSGYYTAHYPSLSAEMQQQYAGYTQYEGDYIHIPTASYWATVPVQTYNKVYQFVRIVLSCYNAGDSTAWLNEVEIYEADSNYDTDWILSGERVHKPAA